MTDLEQSVLWEETVDMAVATLEIHTGLQLAGLSQTEITRRVREWVKVKRDTKA